MRYQPDQPLIYNETFESLQESMVAAGQPKFRAKQVLDWLYKQKVTDWEAMTNLPKALRSWLAGNYTLFPATRVLIKDASDTTQKLLLQLGDGSLIETVLIRAPQFHDSAEGFRTTICISTQVGCAYGCKFCASGLDGWKRDLLTGEIIAQLIEVCRVVAEQNGVTDPKAERHPPFDNIVVMGMGEPLANYDNLLAALRTVNADWGLNFGARRITVSTSGLVPQILRLADEPAQFRLALSLHGATNDVRQQIMPVNRKYPLEELLPAAKTFSRKHGRMLTLEYILIEEVNDTLDQATALGRIANDLHAHVNLIPYNTVEGLPWKRPSLRRQDTFVDALRATGSRCTIRREKGHDIDAACGQLRLQTEKERAGAQAN